MSTTRAAPQDPTPDTWDTRPIEDIPSHELLAAVALSIDSARAYWLGTTTDETTIALGDVIDALDNLRVVVLRDTNGGVGR